MNPKLKKMISLAFFAFIAYWLYQKMTSQNLGGPSGNPAQFSGNGDYSSGYATQGNNAPQTGILQKLMNLLPIPPKPGAITTTPKFPAGKNPGYTMEIGNVQTGQISKIWVQGKISQAYSSQNPAPVKVSQIKIPGKPIGK